MKRTRDDILNPEDDSGNRIEPGIHHPDPVRPIFSGGVPPLVPPPLVPMDSYHLMSHNQVPPLSSSVPNIPLNPSVTGGSSLASAPLNYPLLPTTNTVAYPQPVPSQMQAQQAMSRQVKFENALDFLDQVKLQFAKQPRVYNQFLDIMKDFKAQNIDTPGVIARVKELFAGHGSLIYGFNTFLPPGYKIELDEVEDKPIAPKKQPEFNHARNYVKKIKQRFEAEPQIYTDFLAILHTFNKDSSGIKDVYDQIAVLFKDQTDLLDEFTQFLPDPVQTQQQSRKRLAKKQGARLGNKRPSAQRATDMIKRQTSDDEAGPSAPAATAAGAAPPLAASYEELEFFNRVKNELGSRKLYHEFLKCINLFSQEVITRGELITLVRDLVGSHQELFEWFKNFIGYDEAVDQIPEKKEKQPPVILVPRATYEIDYSTCRRCGPSYRALPRSFLVPHCTGRTEADKAVLNDTWVSVPTGSEDFSFKNSRKNDYEEELFKCEDDRFELDLLIEQNLSAIRSIEPLLRSIQAQPNATTQVLHQLLDSQLDILHVRAIERLYAERGPDVVEAMYANPAGVLPVILQRFREKASELTQDKVESNKVWKKIFEQNYARSLDHQSFYFKQNEKKNLGAKVLVAEIKQEYSNALREKSKRRRQNEEEGSEPHLRLKHKEDLVVFPDMVELLLCTADKILSKSDREKFEPFLTKFVRSLYTDSNEPKDKRKESFNKRDIRVFFGNTQYYLFFRLFHILQQRLEHAVEMADTPAKYHQFKEKVVELLATGMDASTFEDECRSLYGIEAYVLFTMDKLLTNITRQVQSIFASEASLKLATLYELESERQYGANDAVYFENVSEVLGDERCFQLEFGKGNIGITLLDDTYQPTPTFKLLDLELWTKYVKAFVQPAGPNAKHHVFLKRTLIKNPDPTKEVIVQNGLEARLLLKSYRMFYVEKTEDLFFRPGKRKVKTSQKIKIDELRAVCQRVASQKK